MGLLPAGGDTRFGSYDNGFCSAENSSCSGDSYDPWAERDQRDAETEQENQANTQGDQDADGSQQEAEEAETPPLESEDPTEQPTSRLAKIIEQIRSRFGEGAVIPSMEDPLNPTFVVITEENAGLTNYLIKVVEAAFSAGRNGGEDTVIGAILTEENFDEIFGNIGANFSEHILSNKSTQNGEFKARDVDISSS